MKLKEIQARLLATATEMRGIFDGAEAAGTDLSGEKLERWNVLKAERDALTAQEQRAKDRDALDRQEPGRETEQRGNDDGTVTGLKPEARMADYVTRTTGESCANLSIGRAIKGMITGNWDGAENEKRTMASNVGATGGYLMPSPISATIIDLARNASVLVSAGAITLPMQSRDLRVVRIASDPVPAWRSEGSTIAEDDSAFEAVNMVAHSLAVIVRCNAELLDDCPSFSSVIDSQLAAAMATKLDAAGLFGSGSGQPMGLRLTSGVNERHLGASDGASPADYDPFLDLIADIEGANHKPDVLIFAPRTKQSLAKIKTGLSGDLTKLVPPPDYVALRKLVSNQISITETQGSNTDASTAFMGNFANLAIGMRQNITIEASRISSDAFTKNQVLVRAIMRADICALRPAAFGRLIGIRG